MTQAVQQTSANRSNVPTMTNHIDPQWVLIEAIQAGDVVIKAGDDLAATWQVQRAAPHPDQHWRIMVGVNLGQATTSTRRLERGYVGCSPRRMITGVEP